MIKTLRFLASLLVLILLTLRPAVAVTATYTDNFDSDPASSPPPNFNSTSNGSITSGSWEVVAPTSDHLYEASLTNGPLYGNGTSSSILYCSNLGGSNQNNFVLSSTITVKSAPADFNIGMVACALSQPSFLYNYYYVGTDQSGNIFIRSNDTSTSGLTVGTATNLSGGVVVGTTYTLTLVGTYSGGALTLSLTITDGVHNASLTATAATPLTGSYFGYQYDVKSVGGSLVADANNFSVTLGVNPQMPSSFGDNFQSYTAGSQPGGFVSSQNGSVSSDTWSIANPTGTANVYQAAITNLSYAGNGVASSIRGVPYLGYGLTRNFTYSSNLKVVTAPSTYSIGLVAFAGSQPQFLGSYYFAGVNQAGVPFIQSSNGGTSGLTLGTPTDLPGGLVVGTNYTFSLQGTFSSGTLTLALTVTDGTHTGSMSATAATPLTTNACGYQYNVGPTGGQLTVDASNFNIAVHIGAWTQTFDDEFNGTALDTTKWSTGYRWTGLTNDTELEAMRASNVSVSGGVCTIHAQQESTPVMNQNMNDYSPDAMENYSAGAIQSYTKFSQAYGFFEARVQMPSSIGTWPAFWLLPDRGSSYTNLNQRVIVGDLDYIDNPNVAVPMGNEIDIMEYQAVWKNQTTNIAESHGGWIWNPQNNNEGAEGEFVRSNDGTGAALQLANPDTQFHTYGAHWFPGGIVWYVDGHAVNYQASTANVSIVPEYILLNCAITQQNWLGTAPTLATINASLPGNMIIDYVRVWSEGP